MRHKTPVPGTASSRTHRRKDDGILMTHMFGVATGAVVTQMGKDVLAFWRGDSDRVWLVDTTDVPSFTSDLAGPAASFLRELKQYGPTIVAIITSAPVRMMGRTLCFAAGIKLVTVEKLLEADREIRKILDEVPV